MTDSLFVHALALGLEGTWRRISQEERCQSAAEFAAAVAAESEVTTFSYSMVGLQAGTDLLLWSLASSLDALEERSASVLRAGMGKWMTVKESFLGIIQPSQYVKKPTPQEQSLFTGERSRYLIVYPFTKSTDWYLLAREARQGIMNEHMRVGHDFPEVRQLLAYSFGDAARVGGWGTMDPAIWQDQIALYSELGQFTAKTPKVGDVITLDILKATQAARLKA